MADGDDTEREEVAAGADRAAGAARAAPGTGNTARGNATARRAGAGYVMLETSDLQKLEELCTVLDISYNLKLKEFGVRPGNMVKSRMKLKFLNAIDDLKAEKIERFDELRRISRRLIRLWKSTHVPVKKGTLDTVFALTDAQSCNDIVEAKYLRSSLEDDLQAEISRIILAHKTEKRDKYERRKIELKKLMKSAHLSASDIDFDPDQTVEDNVISQATSRIKSKIDQVRESILERKELVFRIQTVQDAITNGWPFKTVKALLQRAKTEATNLKATCGDLKFDGFDIIVFLAGLEEAASSVLDAAAHAHLQAASDSVEFVRSTTRSGARFFVPGTEDDAEDAECDQNTNLDWNDVDKKRMIHAAYRVRDLDATIESYKGDFGMKLLRRVEDPERRCTFAIVGFGPENKTFTLKIASYDGMDTFNIGDGFGNIGISCEVHEFYERIKKTGRCKITCKPASLKTNSPSIAMAQDCNGYLFELIEEDPVHQICQVMLRVKDLETSINFYEKGFGMKLAGKRDLPLLKCTIARLGFDGAASSTFLELTYNYDVEQYFHGDTFLQITIGSDNVGKSFEVVEKAVEELGGKVLQGPEQSKDVAAFEDPDGYKVVIIDNVDFLKEIAIRVADDSEAETS